MSPLSIAGRIAAGLVVLVLVTAVATGPAPAQTHAARQTHA
jgi:hypothetical protein